MPHVLPTAGKQAERIYHVDLFHSQRIHIPDYRSHVFDIARALKHRYQILATDALYPVCASTQAAFFFPKFHGKSLIVQFIRNTGICQILAAPSQSRF